MKSHILTNDEIVRLESIRESLDSIRDTISNQELAITVTSRPAVKSHLAKEIRHNAHRVAKLQKAMREIESGD